MKKLLHILALVPFFGLAQIDVDATGYYLHGTEVQKIYLYGSEVYSKPSGGGETYPFDDAAGPNDLESVTTNSGGPGWHDGVSTDNITYSNPSNGSGGFMVRGTVSGTNAARGEYQIHLEVGTYTRTLVASGNGSNKWRVITPQGLGGTYVTQTGTGGTSDQPFLDGTLTTYTFTVTVTVEDDYQIWFNDGSTADGDEFNVDSDSWIKN